MAVSKEDILETIANMSVMDVVELISAMEEKFGVTAAAPMAAVGMMPAGGAAEEAPAEVAEVEIVHPDGERLRVSKVSADDADYALDGGVPEGRELASSWSVNALGGLLAGVVMDGVRDADGIDRLQPLRPGPDSAPAVERARAHPCEPVSTASMAWRLVAMFRGCRVHESRSHKTPVGGIR